MGASNNVSINVDFKANISQLTSAIGQIKNGLGQLKLPNGVSDSFKKITSNLETELKNFTTLTNSKNFNPLNEKEITRSYETIARLYEQLQNKLESSTVKNSNFGKVAQQVDALSSHWKEFEKSLNSSKENTTVKKLTSDLQNAQIALDKLGTQKQIALQIKVNSEAVLKQYEQIKTKLEEDILKKTTGVKKYEGMDVQGLVKLGLEGKAGTANYIKDFAQQWTEANQKIQEASEHISESVKKVQELDPKISKKNEDITGIEGSLKKAEEALKKFTDTEFKKFISGLSNNADLKKMGLNIDWAQVTNSEQFTKVMQDLAATGKGEAAKLLGDLAKNAQTGGQALQSMGSSVRSAAADLERLTRQEQEVQRLYYQLSHFFSITSGINLFKRAIKSAYSAIKELDKAMTEVAVVTNFSVGDMWDQLPRYTERANELGLAISDVYEASALYYQQGLDTNQVNAMLTSTLHMARIASLDASVATDRMTNAMRGFNMEINEVNSTRVADVYSNLAAKSASNVNELSTAMTKTASIASSANMSFENTAAFLAQGIETTRESADTIGTMLKTVIGRFTEVKKAWTSGDLKAEVEGEEININKVSSALREAGINLNEFFTGARGLDEIFIELSSKWDSLDLVTQRYIATQAAGSRQQSRFIAIMQDYARQQELIGYAYNAAGASQQQYEKTLDSMETKLNQLKNAWDTFTMGIANNAVIKAGIDGLTRLITFINNLTSTLGNTGGLITKVGIAVGGFLGGKALLSGGFKFLVREFLGLGSQSGTSFLQGFRGAFTKGGLTNIVNTIKGKGKTELTGVFAGLGDVADKELTKVFQRFGSKTDWTHIFGKVSDGVATGLRTNMNQIVGSLDLDKIFAGNAAGLSEAKNLVATLNDSNTSATKYGTTLQRLTILTEQNNDATLRNALTLDSVVQKRQQVVQALQSAVGGLTLLATVLSLVGRQLDKAGRNSAGEVFSTLAASAGVAAMALMVLPGIISSVGTAITGTAIAVETVIPPLLIISGIILGLIAIIKIFDAAIENSEEKTERLENSLQDAQQTAKSASDAYEELKTNLDKLKESQDALDGLTRGTEEFQQALINANQQVLNLLETYPMLARYLTTNEYGGLDINKEGISALTEYQYSVSKLAQANFLAAQMSIKANNTRANAEDYNRLFWNDTIYGSGFGAKEYDKDLQTLFENAYKEARDSGTNDIVTAVVNAMNADLAFQTSIRSGAGLEDTVKEWISSYEKFNAYSIQNSSEIQNLLQSLLVTGMSEESKNSEFATIADYYATTQAEAIAAAAEEEQKKLVGWGNGVGGQITDFAKDLVENGLGNVISAEAAQSVISNPNVASVELYQQIYELLTGMKTESTDVGMLSTEIANIKATFESLGDIDGAIKSFENLAKTNQEGAENLASIISGHGSEELVDKIIADIGKDKTMGDVAQSLDLTFDQLQQLSKDMGYGIGTKEMQEFIKVIRTQAQETKRQQQQERVETMQQLAMTGGNRFVESRLPNMVTKLTLDEVEGLGEIADQIGTVLSEATTTQLTAALAKGTFELKDVSWLKELNVSDAVGSFEKITEKIEELQGKTDGASIVLRDFYKRLQQAPEFDTQHQFNQVYSEISEDLDDILEKKSGLTDDALQDLIEDNKNLAKFLKNTKMETSTLGKILKGLKNGEIPIQGLTNRVIEFLASLKTTQGEIKKVQDRLSDFKEFDDAAGMDTIKDWSDKVKEYVENYEYANAIDILEQFFSVEEMREHIGNWEQMTEDELDQAITQLGSRMQNLTSNDGFNALYGYYTGSEVVGTKNENSILARMGTSYIDENGIGNVDIDYDLLRESRATIETLATELASAEGITQDIATTILSSVAARDVKLKLTLDTNAYENALVEFATENGDKVSQIYTAAELKAMGEAIGKSAEQVKADLEATLGKSIKVLDLLDDTGVELMGQSLHESLMSSFEGDLNSTLTSIVEASGMTWGQIQKGNTLDLDKLVTAFQNVGLSSEQALSEITMLNGELDTVATKTVEIPIYTKDANGNYIQDGSYEITVECEDASAVTEQIDAAVEAANTAILTENISSAVADAIAAAASGEAINFSVSVEGSAQAISETQEALDTLTAESYEVTVTYSTVEEAKTATDKLNEAKIDDKQYTVYDNGTTVTLKTEAQNLRYAIDQLHDKSYTITANYVTNGSPAPTQLLGTAHASGVGMTSRSENALTGEMGPEMVVTGDRWYTVGNRGPEFAHIPKGSIVFNARQTRDLLSKGYTNTRGRAWASGTAYAKYKLPDPVPNPYNAPADDSTAQDIADSTQSAAESSEEAAKVWLNTLDKLYNLVQVIEEETRRREILEKQYQKLLRSQNLTLAKIRDNYDAQLRSLEASYEEQKQLRKGRRDQLKDVLNEKYQNGDEITTYAGMGVDQYAKYDMDTNTIQIDWDKIDQITDENLGKAVEAYISRLETLSDQYEDTQEELYNIEEEIYKLNESYREAYLSLEQRIYDALVEQEEKRIENIEEIYNRIEESNTAVLESLREQVELERQIRDNTKKEEDIADKENRLAYLRRDTSNGNQVEIKQLEKELAEMRESYANELIDQKLDKLGEDNEKAAAQREREIQTLKDILEYNKEHGHYWDTVKTLIQEGFKSESGGLKMNSDLVKLLKQTDGFNGMSTFAQDKWMEELVVAFETGVAGLEKLKVEEAKKKGEAQLNSTTKLVYDKSSGKWMKQTYDSKKKTWVTDKDYTFDLAYNASTGKYSGTNKTAVKKPAPPKPSTPSTPKKEEKPKSNVTDATYKNVAAAIWVYNGDGSGWGDDPIRGQRLTQKFGSAGAAKVRSYIDSMAATNEYYTIWANMGFGNALKNSYGYWAFKTGGLANFTGPAWLDGTKNRPELVLNQKDTQNFITLKDVLSDILSKQGRTSESKGGDNYFDININVEKIDNDYDVEQLSEKIKEEIKKDSLYRNVNSLNFLR